MNLAGAASAASVVVLSAALRAAVRRRRAQRVARRLPAFRDHRTPVLRVGAPARLTALLDDAGIDNPAPGVACTAALAAGVAVALVGAISGGIVLGVLLPVLVAAAGVGALAAMRGRGDRRYASSLPLTLELVARSLRSGASLQHAIADAGAATSGAVGADLRAIAERCALGSPLVASVEAWARARPLPSVRLAAAALCLGAEAGGAQARAIDGVASTLRDRLALHAEVRALTSQARTSALVITVAPLAFCAITVAADSESAAFLLRTPAGLALLVLGLALDGVAAAWMHRLTGRVTA